MTTQKQKTHTEPPVDTRTGGSSAYPLELVAQIAATLAANRPIHKAASDAIVLLKACERELNPALWKRSISEIGTKLLDEARSGYPAGSFKKEILRITKQKTGDDALARIRLFLKYEVEHARQPSLELLSRTHGFDIAKMRLRTPDEQVKMQLALHEASGLGGLSLADFEERYATWYHDVFRSDAAEQNRENGKKGGWPKGKPRGARLPKPKRISLDE